MASTVKTLTPASGLLTFSANAADTDVITIAGVAYTYVASGAVAADHELVPAGSIAATVTALIDAINGGVAGMPRNPHVFAQATAETDEVQVVARISGTVGNFIPSVSSEVDITWGADTLEGGAGDAGKHLDDVLSMNSMNGEVIAELLKFTGGSD